VQSNEPERRAERHNLPAETDSFVGRVHALDELKRLLATNRMVTITGPGGSGKTRLALHLAADIINRYRDGVWFVDLAPVDNPALVPRVLAAACGVHEAPDYPLAAALAAAFATKHLLLILDNCEHVLGACADLATTLLHDSRTIKILATSREPLRIAGEVTWLLPPLTPPAPGQHLATLQQNEAMRLFLDRAQARQPGFQLTTTNAAAIVAICHRLDGIPLAIELAAALVSAFSVNEIATLLDDALPLLTRGSYVTPRQTTLRATLDWSYALLNEHEQTLFRRLAVFHGGWTLDAVIAICAGRTTNRATLDHANIPATLAALVDKSLAIALPASTTTRYRFLEPVRQYAITLLREHGELDLLRERHARYFTGLAETLSSALFSAHRHHALAILTPEIDNLRAALVWALPPDAETPPAAEHVEIGLRLSGALFGFWHFRGLSVEGSRWLETALRWRGERADATLATALYAAGELAFLLGNYDLARERLEESIRLRRSLDDARGLAYALQALAVVTEQTTGWAAVKESLALFAQLGDAWGSALARTDIGLLLLRDGNTTSARAQLEEVAAQFRALGDEWFAAQALMILADILRSEGRDSDAMACYAQVLTLIEQCQDTALRPGLLYNLGSLALARRQTRLALHHLQQALAQFRDRGDQRGIAECLIGLGNVFVALKQPERAVRLYGAAEALLARAGATLWSTNLAAYAQSRAAARAQLSPEQFTHAWTAGQMLSLASILDETLPNQPRISNQPADRSGLLAAAFATLTPREREVTILVARGYSNKQIADALVITPGTAKLHVKHILHKLGCTSRAQLAAQAVAAELLPHQNATVES